MGFRACVLGSVLCECWSCRQLDMLRPMFLILSLCISSLTSSHIRKDTVEWLPAGFVVSLWIPKVTTQHSHVHPPQNTVCVSGSLWSGESPLLVRETHRGHRRKSPSESGWQWPEKVRCEPQKTELREIGLLSWNVPTTGSNPRPVTFYKSSPPQPSAWLSSAGNAPCHLGVWSVPGGWQTPPPAADT